MEVIMMIGLLFIYLPGVLPLKITHINALVNEPVTLPCEIECTGGTKWTIIFPNNDKISDCNKDACWITDPFQESFFLQEDRTRGKSLHIKPVKYNDRGSYRCSCDGKEADIKLKVFAPVVVKAYELENILLPCYGDTRKDATDLQWKKYEQNVLLYVDMSGTLTLGEGFEDRFSMSPKAFQDGNLSLHISSVQPTDAGLYLCSLHGESREGDPRAVLLKVEGQSLWWFAAVIELALIVLLSAIIVVCGVKNKMISCTSISLICRKANTDPPPSVQEECTEMLNINSSVKVSSTEPF